MLIKFFYFYRSIFRIFYLYFRILFYCYHIPLCPDHFFNTPHLHSYTPFIIPSSSLPISPPLCLLCLRHDVLKTEKCEKLKTEKCG